MDETVEERLATVERALTDGDADLSALAEANDVAGRVDALETRLEEQDGRIAELEAATQALRGYVGNVRAVNEDVRQQAERALEVAESDEGAIGEEAEGSDVSNREPTLELGNEAGRQQRRGGVSTEEAVRQPERKREPRDRDDQQPTGAADGSGSREDDGCPLCSGGGRRQSRNSGGEPAVTTDATQNPARRQGDGEHHGVGTVSDDRTTDGIRDSGITDGGLTISAESRSVETEASLLHRIRTLL